VGVRRRSVGRPDLEQDVLREDVGDASTERIRLALERRLGPRDLREPGRTGVTRVLAGEHRRRVVRERVEVRALPVGVRDAAANVRAHRARG